MGVKGAMGVKGLRGERGDMVRAFPILCQDCFTELFYLTKSENMISSLYYDYFVDEFLNFTFSNRGHSVSLEEQDLKDQKDSK